MQGSLGDVTTTENNGEAFGSILKPVGVFRRLPEHPLVTIRPGRRWQPLNLRELVAHRDLFGILVLRDVTIRYKQTFLGIAWAVIQPLMMMLIYTLLFGRLAGMPSDGIAYPLFAFAALL